MSRADPDAYSPAADILGGLTTFVTMAYIGIAQVKGSRNVDRSCLDPIDLRL